jgi:hypothetical protein
MLNWIDECNNGKRSASACFTRIASQIADAVNIRREGKRKHRNGRRKAQLSDRFESKLQSTESRRVVEAAANAIAAIDVAEK